MDDIKKVVEGLREYPLRIHDAMIRAEDLRLEWDKKKAFREAQYAKEYLKSKASDSTDGESRQKAVLSIYLIDMDVIVAESAYKKALAELSMVENEFAAVRKEVGLHEAVILKLGTTLAQL